jgi:hypothetical protein
MLEEAQGTEMSLLYGVTALGVVSLGEVGWSFRPVVWQDCARLPNQWC